MQHLAADVCVYMLDINMSPTSYFASAAVIVDCSHMTASSSAPWRRFRPRSYFVNGHMSTMWFVVSCWPQSQEGDSARPHLCKLAWHGPWPSQKRFIRDIYDESEAESIQTRFGVWSQVGPVKCVSRGPDPQGKGLFWGHVPTHWV